MFPVTDSSETVIDCLLREAQNAGVALHANQSIEEVSREGGAFRLRLKSGEVFVCDRLVLATGGCRTAAMANLAISLGHTLEPPVPSLFSFHISLPWLRSLAGVSVPLVEASVPGSRLVERGPVLITHSGLSGPAILRLSAWGARILHERSYKFDLRINWCPALTEDSLRASLLALTKTSRLVVNTPQPPIPARLWKELVLAAGISDTTRWATLGKSGLHNLVKQLTRTIFPVSGKSLNKDEFVTCGGVKLSEVNFKTMESRVCPGLYLAGELLDIDGITGGFNFQAAWTTGWLAGKAIAQS